MLPPEQNPPENENRNPETSEAANSASASTSTGKVEGHGPSAKHAARSAMDRVRPALHRVQERVAPLVTAVLEWLRRVLPPAVVRFLGLDGDRDAEGSGIRVNPKRRALQLGSAVAAVGVLALVLSSTGDGQRQGVDDAAHTAALPEQGVPAQLQSGQDTERSGIGGLEAKSGGPPGPQAVGIDVSNHNENINWQKVAKEGGQHFAFILASDGTDFANKKFEQQKAGAKDAGLLTGAYHFARPDEPPEVQADRFLQTIRYQDDGKTLPPVLDLEVDPKGGGCFGKSPAEMENWVKAFNGKVKQATNKDSIIYSSPSFWSKCTGDSKAFKHNPLWLASYGVDKPKVPAGWKDYSFWQHTSTGKVAGVQGDVDMNKFNGSVKELHALAQK